MLIQPSITNTMKTYNLYWAPEGKRIATVQASDPQAAIRKAPRPYRKYLGEIWAENVEPMQLDAVKVNGPNGGAAQ